MPRKPKLGPPILRIEGLSTGIDPTLRDDWTGELLAQPKAKPPRIQDAQAEHNRINRAKADSALQMLQAVGIVKADSAPQLVAPTVQGMQPIATLGTVAVYAPKKPFRRI